MEDPSPSVKNLTKDILERNIHEIRNYDVFEFQENFICETKKQIEVFRCFDFSKIFSIFSKIYFLCFAKISLSSMRRWIADNLTQSTLLLH